MPAKYNAAPRWSFRFRALTAGLERVTGPANEDRRPVLPDRPTGGEVALVTGANKGIGRAIVTRLTAEEMTVYLGARDVQRGRDAERELSRAHDRPDRGVLRGLRRRCDRVCAVVNQH